MKKSKLVLILCLAAWCGFGFKGCAKKINPANEPLLRVFSDVTERTTKGILIASQTGVSSEFKEAADQELEKLFDDARALGYTNDLNFSDYTVYVLPNCQLSPEQHTRSFLIRADSYDGSIYDQDARPGFGKVFAAEMVIAGPFGQITNEYVVCDAAAGVDEELRNALRYGPEHIILKRNDEAEFQRTWYHGNGISHPLIPSAKKPETSAPIDPRSEEAIDLFGRTKN